MYGFMAIAYFWFFRDLIGAKLEVNSVEFWFMMQIAMWCRLITSYLGQVLDPRAGGAGFGCVSIVEPLQVVIELGVGKTDELLQRRSRKVTILVVDSLDPGAVNREQLLAEQVQL